jgi:septal ring factor EnvC (AmiA/AmiB activator)
MAEFEQGAAAAAPTAFPEIRKPDLQMLLQDLAQWQRTVFDERRQSQRALADERERSRWEQERIRTEFGDRLRDFERQNDVLIRSLSRLQGDNERLREQVAVLRAARTNGHPPPARERESQTPPAGYTGVPGAMMAPAKMEPLIVVMPPAPPLGGVFKVQVVDPLAPKPSSA